MQNNIFEPENIKIFDYNIVMEQITSPLRFDSGQISYHGFHVDMELDINPGNEC